MTQRMPGDRTSRDRRPRGWRTLITSLAGHATPHGSRLSQAPHPTGSRHAESGLADQPDATRTAQDGALWRLRTTVRDSPGSLAALCTALAQLDADIVTVQTHPLTDGTVDELLLRASHELSAGQLSAAVAQAGGQNTWVERADAHDLVDSATWVLHLATTTATDPTGLPLALCQLLGRCTVSVHPATSPATRHHDPAGDPMAEPDFIGGTTIRLAGPRGDCLIVNRPQPPFTPAEFARSRALVALHTKLTRRRLVHGCDQPAPRGRDIRIRRAGLDDLEGALALHQRCSPITLSQRYHGPVADADRYLPHVLGPRCGQTLAAEGPDGQVVALAHLLWDGDETEVALLVEDAWQRRGIGGELLRRLASLAAEAGCSSIYTITQANNRGMVATMQQLGLPLDYHVADGTLVITAWLTTASDLHTTGAGAG